METSSSTIWLGCLGRACDAFVARDPETTGFLVSRMEYHLEHTPWGRRSFDYYNVPLRWMQRVAKAAGNAGELDLLEDACSALFRQEPGLDRWRQKDRSLAWIASLTGPAAARVAQVLREHPRAIEFYGQLKHAADPAIRRVLLSAKSE